MSNEPAAQGGDGGNQEESGCCDSCCCCCGCCAGAGPCCACCCGDGGQPPPPEYLMDNEQFFDYSSRPCTDCLMIWFYGALVIGWLVIISLAAEFGKPDRLIKPENFRGELCGDGALDVWPNYFVPLPSRSTYGICVKTCPDVGDIVCNNDLEFDLLPPKTVKVRNSKFGMTRSEFVAGHAAQIACLGTCTSGQRTAADKYIATRLKIAQRKCFAAIYPSGPLLLRCIPGKSKTNTNATNTTLMSLANESLATINALADTLGVGNFFMLGFAEVKQCWRVILICAFTCMALGFIWVYLLRWILAPIVYLCILLILVVLIGLGLIFMWFADDLEKGALPGETGVEEQAKFWRAMEYIAFLAAAIYIGVMLYMLNRIRIAIAVMDQASRAFITSPTMTIVPFITFALLLFWVAFFVVTSVYIQTMGSEANEKFKETGASYIGADGSADQLVTAPQNPPSSISTSATVNGQNTQTQNVSKWLTLPETKVLHLYNFFMVLWTGNFSLLFGYFIMVMVVVCWYFSATQENERLAEENTGETATEFVQEMRDRQREQQKEQAEAGGGAVSSAQEAVNAEQDKALDDYIRQANKEARFKDTPYCVICSAMKATFLNHLGTILWGALLIAIIQFIRAIFTYLAEQWLSKEQQENCGAKILVRCMECCLWYIEQVVKIISKNAFIVTAIRGTSFCVSAFGAVALLLDNIARFSILAMLSAATLFVIKVLIVGCNMMLAFLFITRQSLTEDRNVESGLFPMLLILVMSFVIAALFMSVYEACIDTIFMCFLVDEKDYGGQFMPAPLAKLVSVYTEADEARKAYEKRMRAATDPSIKIE